MPALLGNRSDGSACDPSLCFHSNGNTAEAPKAMATEDRNIPRALKLLRGGAGEGRFTKLSFWKR